MSILINKQSRVITQGITGKTGQFHTRNCLDYAEGKDCFVAGVTPGKGGQEFEGIPIFDSVAEARAETTHAPSATSCLRPRIRHRCPTSDRPTRRAAQGGCGA